MSWFAFVVALFMGADILLFIKGHREGEDISISSFCVSVALFCWALIELVNSWTSS